MRAISIIIATICLFVFPVIVNAEEMVTVKLKNYIGDKTKLTFSFKGDYVTPDPLINLEKGVKYRLEYKDGTLFLRDEGGKIQTLNEPFIVVPHKYDRNHVITINDRPYLGAMLFKIEDEAYIRPVNQLPLEDYLKGVVPFEVFPTWGLETLKAQTLAARTYTMAKIGLELDDTISYQVYGGFAWAKNPSRAVDETKGEVITFNGEPIETYYSASNGGMTENNKNVWGDDAKSYFPIKEDPYDPGHPWKFKLHKQQIKLEDVAWDAEDTWDAVVEKNAEIAASIKKWLHKNGYPGEIKLISIPKFSLSEEKRHSGRSINGSFAVTFLHRLFPGFVLYEKVELENVGLDSIRPIIGGNLFKSYLIESLEMKNGVYEMKGRGYGHGVGMSQWGAYVMGEKGKTYREIIQFYYPGTKIKKIN